MENQIEMYCSARRNKDRIEINPLSRVVIMENQEIKLTTMEFDVLYFLASNPNIAFTKEQIYEAVMKDGYTEATYVIRNIICRIKKKTGLQNIKTMYGFGYKFERSKD